MSQPTVSIIMLTYGHEKYIEKAIRSVFMQKTNFDCELIIANDNSPDNTDVVVKKVILDAPENISVRYVKHEKNMTMNPNFLWALKECKGKYIALCEGDDYWLDDHKLQKQVDFMDKNSDFSMYFHKSQDDHAKILQDLETKIYSEQEILNSWYIHTASVLFPNSFEEPDYKLLASDKIHFYDLILFLILANKGKVWGTNENMSFYRYIETSITNTSKKIEYYESLFNHLDLISTIYDSKYKPYNKHRVKSQAYKLFRHYALKGNPKTIKYLLHYIKN
ncbi:glycosyltransferase family 2 protein [Chryseobacterium sp.]|uniref:glycosyltransferase family 2 protein n=1 Tax=Chryseobacterium sp. TaxID=1871047 RepID=UPI00388F92B4